MRTILVANACSTYFRSFSALCTSFSDGCCRIVTRLRVAGANVERFCLHMRGCTPGCGPARPRELDLARIMIGAACGKAPGLESLRSCRSALSCPSRGRAAPFSRLRELCTMRKPRRHGRTWCGHPRLSSPPRQGVGGRAKPGHDGEVCAHPAPTPMHQARMPFWACSRFSASSNTTECGPSITASVTSSPRWAGRQCMKIASALALPISSALTW